MVLAISTRTEEPLGKLTGLGGILWYEVNQCSEETTCSLAPESKSHRSDLDWSEHEKIEDIPEVGKELELEGAWIRLALEGVEAAEVNSLVVTNS